MKKTAIKALSLFLAVLMLLGTVTVTAFGLETVPSSGAKVIGNTYSDESLTTKVDPLSYKVGDTIVFGFELKNGSTNYTAPYLYYKVQRDDGITETGYTTFNENGVAVVTTTITREGFAYITAYPVESYGSTSNMMGNTKFDGSAGANVTDIKTVYARPADFEAYWAEVLAQLTQGGCEIEYIYDLSAKVSGYYLYEIQISCPEDSHWADKLHRTSWGTTYETSRPDDNHVSAYLAIPESASASNKLGLSLAFTGYDWVIPGTYYNTEGEPNYTGLCDANSIKLSVSAHSLSMPHNVAADASSSDVTNGAYNANYYYKTLSSKYGYSSWHGKEYDATKDNNYFKYMIMRDVQAVKFLEKFFGETGGTSALADVTSWAGLWNGTDISVSGASQGGYQSVAVASLCPEVTSFSVGVPWFGDESAKSPDSIRMKPTSPRDFAYVDGLRYVDIANLATLMSASTTGRIVMGLGDTLCPPSTIFSIYNNMQCAVTLTAYQNAGHGAGDKGSGNGAISKYASPVTEETYCVTVSDNASVGFETVLSDFENAFNASSGNKLSDTGTDGTVKIISIQNDNTKTYNEYKTELEAEARNVKYLAIVIAASDRHIVSNYTAAAYALSNDKTSNVYVISNDKTTLSASDAAELGRTLAYSIGGGNQPTPDDGEIVICDENGALSETFTPTSATGEKIVAVVTTPLWAAQQGIRATTKFASLDGGKLTVETDKVGDGVSAQIEVATNRLSNKYFVSEPVTASGPCGENLRYELGTSGTLYIRGTGNAVVPCNSEGNAVSVSEPWTTANHSATSWYGIRDSVKKIVFEAPVTSVKGYSFALFDSCTTVELNKEFTNLNGSSFNHMGALTTVYTEGQTAVTGTANLTAVSSIGSYVFNEAKLGKVVFNDGIKTIPGSAFYNCQNLTSVTIPKDCTSIGGAAFGQCTALTSVVLGRSLTDIASDAFTGCSKLTDITVNNMTADMDKYNMSQFTALTSVTCVEDSTADVWAKAQGYTEGNGITYILPDVDFEGALDPWGSYAAQTWSYDKDTKALTLADGGYDFDLSLYAKNSSYNQLIKYYGDKVQTIIVNTKGGGKLWNRFALLNCPNVTRIEVSSNRDRLHAQSTPLLYGMSKLTTFGKIGSVKDGVIDFSFFTTIRHTDDNSRAPKNLFNGLSSATEIILPANALYYNEVKSTNPSYPTIGEGTFNGCTSLTTVTIPAYVTSIEANAFAGCTSLSEITIPSTVTSIDNTAFAGLTVTLIGKAGGEAERIANLSDTDGITFRTAGEESNIVVEDKLIGEDADGKKLYYKIVKDTVEDGAAQTYTMVIYGDGKTCKAYDADGNLMTKYSWDADFSSASYVNAVDDPKAIKTIKIETTNQLTSTGGYMFNKLGIETIELPEVMKTLPSDWFNGLTTVKTVYTKGQTPKIGTADLTGITSIGSYAFVDNKFTDVVLDDGLTSIGSWAFGRWNSASSATALTIPASVTSIGENAFKNFKDLTSVTFKGVGTTINASAFVDCANLTTIYGYKGSTAETFAADKGYTFVELDAEDESIVVKDKLIGEDSDGNKLYYKIVKDTVEDGAAQTYTMVIYGDGKTCKAYDADGNLMTKYSWDADFSSASYVNAVDDPKAIKTIKIETTNQLTSTGGYMFNKLGIETVEFPEVMKKLPGDWFNGLTTVKTVYTKGQTPEVGTANMTNFTVLGAYTFYQNKFTRVLVGEGVPAINDYTFAYSMNATDAKSGTLVYIELPESVTSIGGNAFNGQPVTIVGVKGSYAETYANANGVPFIEKSEYSEVLAYGKINGKQGMNYIVGKVDDNNYTLFLTGPATDFRTGYGYNVASGSKETEWNEYASKITKAKIVNQNVTAVDGALARLSNCATVEIPASLVTLYGHAMNGTRCTTIFVTGNEPVIGTADLRNITTIGECSIAYNNASHILFSDDLADLQSTSNFFYALYNIAYLRLPKNISKMVSGEFNGCTNLKTILIENPDCAITDGAVPSSVTTLIGYPNSTAQTYAVAKGLEFVPITASGVLDFAGFSLRKSEYNGLRSEFHFDRIISGEYSAKGLKVVEFGTLISATDNIEVGSTLGVAKDANGKYVVSGTSSGIATKIMEEGEYTEYLANCTEFTNDAGNDAYKFFVTITNYNENNYNKLATFRGYAVLEDADGNRYVVYADLLDSESNPYNSQSLATMVDIQMNAGLIDETCISYIDVKRFRDGTSGE